MKEKIINYIIEKYDPEIFIIYGSYVDGSNNENSDLDGIIFTNKKCEFHNGEIVDGVMLDVFIHHTSEFNNRIDFSRYVQIFDGKILIDKTGRGRKLLEGVKNFIANNSTMPNDIKIQSMKWCKKMLMRTKRNDAEGYFRWHWLIMDSLELYCNFKDKYYFGPKKTLIYMEKEDSKAYELYNKALSSLDYQALENWILYLEKTF